MDKMLKNLFDPQSKNPYRISRTKIQLFLNCPRCFYLDRRLGISTPPLPSFTLNSAVDHLLKKEFDIHRVSGNPHPLMKEYGIDAVPLAHEKLDIWRNAFKGISYHHPKTNFILFGGIDDIWKNPKDELLVVDYKATSTREKITLEGQYKEAYKRQVEFYQWILRRNGFKVSNAAYFVYCNGKRDREAFDGKLEFEVEIIPYQGSDSWVEPTVIEARKCLESEKFPETKEGCPFCYYTNGVSEALRK